MNNLRKHIEALTAIKADLNDKVTLASEIDGDLMRMLQEAVERVSCAAGAVICAEARVKSLKAQAEKVKELL